MPNGNPDPIRLRELIQLRRAVGLSQEEAAARCGLTTVNGRRTFAAWEQGESRPRRSNQPNFVLYLLRDLNLRLQPDRFDEIYAILMDEWDWPGFRGQERADFLHQAAQPYVPFAPPPEETELSADSLTPTEEWEAADPPSTAQATGDLRPFWQRWILVAAAGLLLLLAAFLLYPTLLARPQPPTPPSHPTASPTETLVPSPTPNPLENLSFENGLAPWYWAEEGKCDHQIVADETRARDAVHFLSVQRGVEECISLRKPLGQLPMGANTVSVALWVRSPQQPVLDGELVIWAGESPLGNETVREKAVTVFQLADAEWRCVETSLAYDADQKWEARAELYFKSQPSAVYEIDGAAIGFGGASLCPPAPVALLNGSFERGDDLIGWEWLDVPCDFALVETPGEAVDGNRYLSLSRKAGCNSLLQNLRFSPEVGQEYTARVWVRSPGPDLARGQLVLWAPGAEEGKARQDFIAGPVWQCVETTVHIASPMSESIRAELYFDSPPGNAIYQFDGAAVEAGKASLCPPQAIAVSNGDFEESQLTGWQIEPCSGELRQSEEATSGNFLLEASRNAPNCDSIYHDTGVILQPGDRVRGSVWLRTQGGLPANGRLALWAIGAVIQENSITPIRLADEKWRCVETELIITQPGHLHLRWELYLDSSAPVTYLVDDARLGRADQTFCPTTELRLGNTRVYPLRTAYYPGGMIGIETELQNLGGMDFPAGGRLAVWLSAAADGAPLDPSIRQYTALAAGMQDETSKRMFIDAEVPRPLQPGGYYIVAELQLPTGVSDPDKSNNRESRPVTIAACDPQNRYCDVNEASWGAEEIERWFVLGISTGCRSNTEPFLDRPFCPDYLVTREVVPIFLLRHMRGGTHAPPDASGLFSDFREFNGGRDKWAEEFIETGVELTSERCPQMGEQPIFCPNQWVTRGELLLYLAQTLEWILTPVQGDQFIDVSADTPINQAIETAARSGFLAENDPYCPNRGDGPAFCPDEPARRAFAAVVMARAFAAAPHYPIVD